MTEHAKWQWQQEGTSWKGIGIYHVTLTVPTREALLGTLVIPNNDPAEARVEQTELRRVCGHAAHYIIYDTDIGLGCDGQSHHFQVGKGGNNASARYISLLVYLISCKFLAYLKNVSELCNEVVHTYDDSA